MEKPLPVFEHDCSECTFLGQFIASDGQTFDVYCCDRGSALGASYIVRYGDEPHEYYSAPFAILREMKIGAFVAVLEPVQKRARRAQRSI